jgi:hypothetical protein
MTVRQCLLVSNDGGFIVTQYHPGGYLHQVQHPRSSFRESFSVVSEELR